MEDLSEAQGVFGLKLLWAVPCEGAFPTVAAGTNRKKQEAANSAAGEMSAELLEPSAALVGCNFDAGIFPGKL